VRVKVNRYDKSKKIWEGVVEAYDRKDGKLKKTCYNETWVVEDDEGLLRLTSISGIPAPGPSCPA